MLGGFLVAVAGLGALVEVRDEGHAEVEAQRLHVWQAAGRKHGFEDLVCVGHGVGVDVVADAGFHCGAVGERRGLLDEGEDGGGFGAGFGAAEGVEEAEPVVLVGPDVVREDDVVPVFGADAGARVDAGGGGEDEGERVAAWCDGEA